MSCKTPTHLMSGTQLPSGIPMPAHSLKGLDVFQGNQRHTTKSKTRREMDKNKKTYIEPLNDLINTVKSIQMEYKNGPEHDFEKNSVMVGGETVLMDTQPAHEIVHYSGAGGGVRSSTFEEFDFMNSRYDYKDNNHIEYDDFVREKLDDARPFLNSLK